MESYKYQVLAVATDAKTKQESQNIKSGKKVVVSVNIVSSVPSASDELSLLGEY